MCLLAYCNICYIACSTCKPCKIVPNTAIGRLYHMCLRFTSSNKKYSIGAFTSKNNKGKKENLRGFATGLIYSDKIVLEYKL